MEDMADKHMRAARTLFNLAHCYLHSTNIDDEQDDKYEEDVKNKTTKKDFQQTEKEEVNGKKNDTFDKKQETQHELDNEIELYLQVQVESKYQEQLCKNIQNKDLKKQKPEIEIELKIEIPQEFDGPYLKNVDKEKQHFKEKVEKKSKKYHELNQKKERENIQELIYSEINADSEFQYGTEREMRLTQNINKDNVLVDLSGKSINSLNTQDQIQKGIEIKSQEKDNSDVLLDYELQEQKNIHENLMESFHRSIQKRIERLIYEIPIEEQKINDELRQEIEELNKEIKELDPEHFNELNKEILEEVSKKDYLPVQVKYFKNLYCSFIQDSAPFYNRLDQMSNDKTQTAVQQKLNEEFLKKLDSLLLKKCNEETQEAVNGDERIRNQFEDIDGKEKYQRYDLVIQYNHEMSQELEGHTQQVSGKKMLVDFYDDAVKTHIHKSDKDALREKLCKAGTDVIDQTQKEGNKNIIFQLEFYKNVQVEEELQKKNEKQLQNNTEEEINRDLILKTKENEIEVQEDLDVEIEDFEEEIQVYSEIANDDNFEEVQENSKLKIEASERAIIVESGVKTEDSEKEVQEDSDVDIEGFEGEILEFPEINSEDFKEESQENTDSDTENLSEEEFNDINEVVEIVEDIEVESNCSIDDNIPSNKIPTSTCNELNLKIDPNSNIKHNEEEKLKTINSSDSTIITDHIKEKQTFFELEHQLNELSQEYKGYVQQKVLKELEQEIDDKQLQEMEIFPDTLNEVNSNIKDFKKEIEDLQSELCQLKPEFMNNVPFSFKEDNSSKKLKEKPFNLFDKLHSIHRKLLCKFADSKEWPENCFQPSSLLDVLFEDPTEFKPNVLIIILYSADEGYMIQFKREKYSKPPKNYYFKYSEDTILEHMENEHLPPDLLDFLDGDEDRLFYSGCIIAEIHDQVYGVPGRVYRLILRPSNLSIQRDIDRIIAKNRHATNINYWSYNKRLRLESILLKKSYPVMCMDSSPIAGLVVNLQHQVLSSRTIVLNPFKKKKNYSEPNPLETDSFDESNDSLNTSMVSNEPQEISSKLVDSENTNIENHVLWKFEFRIKSLKLFKMFVIYITETQEFSMLLCTNSKIDSIKRIRFMIQPLQDKMNAYINIMREILREKISPDIEAFQRYKCQHNSTPLSFKSIPSLLNNKMYKASHADISQLINIFISNSNIKYLNMNKKLEDMCSHNSGITTFETEKGDLSLMQEKLTADTQKTNEIKENSRDPEVKKSMLFCATKKLSTNSKKFLDVLNVDLVDKIPDSSSLKTQTIPKDILFYENTSLEPSLILDLSKMDLKDEIADLSLLKPQTISKDILFNDGTMPLLKEKLINTETISSLEPLLITPIHAVSENANSLDLVQEKILSVSSGSMTPIFRFLTTTTPIESSPAVVLSSLSIVNSLVTSIKTYMLPMESPSLGYIAKTESLSIETDENLLTSTFNDGDDDTHIESLPVMQPDDLIHLTKIDDIAVNMFYYINQITPKTRNEMSSTENIFTMFSKSECVEEILEDQYMLRCLQLFHRQPTLPDISIPPNTLQENEDGFPDNI